VVLEAVKQDGRALEYADDSLKSDREVVLEAVKSNGWALQFAKSCQTAVNSVIIGRNRSHKRGISVLK
jgi:hypothetical protein